MLTPFSVVTMSHAIPRVLLPSLVDEEMHMLLRNPLEELEEWTPT